MLIRFVSRFTVHLCNAIYFLTIFNTSCKRFIKFLYFTFWNLNKAIVFPIQVAFDMFHHFCFSQRNAATWTFGFRRSLPVWWHNPSFNYYLLLMQGAISQQKQWESPVSLPQYEKETHLYPSLSKIFLSFFYGVRFWSSCVEQVTWHCSHLWEHKSSWLVDFVILDA